MKIFELLIESGRKTKNVRFSSEDLINIFQEDQKNNWQPSPDKAFMRGDLYRSTYAIRVKPYPAIRKKLRDFMELKRNNPTAPFGGSDKSFSSDGIYNSVIPGLRHAHITFDLSIVYKIVGKQIYLYGLFTHDDLGTGQPRNINRQKNAAKTLAQQNFTETHG